MTVSAYLTRHRWERSSKEAGTGKSTAGKYTWPR
jgi:hypothetical protein